MGYLLTRALSIIILNLLSMDLGRQNCDRNTAVAMVNSNILGFLGSFLILTFMRNSDIIYPLKSGCIQAGFFFNFYLSLYKVFMS